MKELLAQYENAVRSEWQSLKRSLGTDNPLGEWLHRRVTQEGTYGDNGERRYRFHGMGVTINTPECEVSFDVTNDSQSAIFDVEKFREFVVSKEGEDKDLDVAVVRAALARIAGSGDLRVDTYRSASFLFPLELATDAAE